MEKKVKYIKIKPKYIKDENGKTTDIYLDLKTYDAIIKTLQDFEQEKKELKKKIK